MKSLLVRLFLAVLSVLPMAVIILSEAVYADDGLNVQFELIRESPVSVEFEVTIIGTKDTTLPVKFAIEPLYEGETATEANLITVTELVKENYIEQNPIYKEVEGKYTSVFGIWEKVRPDENMPQGTVVDTFRDYDKGGKVVLKEHYYTGFDAKALTWTWTESVIDYYEQIPKVRTTEVAFAERTKLDKLAISQLSVKSQETKGYGEGVRTFRVVIKNPIGRNRDGWGSKGLLVWDINGQKYFDKTNSSWWNGAWQYKKKITLDNSAQAANLINFPVGVFLDVGNFDFSHAQAALQDIRFVDADDATDLDYEIPLSSLVANTSAEIWVEVPQVDASSNTDFIWMYYGNGAVADGQDVAGTWNANYKAVYHMNDANTSTITDSTGTMTGTKRAANNPLEAVGQTGKAQDWEKANSDYITRGAGQYLSTFTIETSINPESLPTLNTDATLVNRARITLGSQHNYWFNLSNVGGTQKYLGGIHNGTGWVSIVKTRTFGTGAWSNIAFSYDGINDGQLYYNGGAEALDSDTINGTPYSTANFSSDIGAQMAVGGAYTNFYDGLQDEVRISNIARSAQWIAATNMTLVDTYCSYGAEVVVTPLPPTNFVLTQTDVNEITATWVAGFASTDTMIRYSTVSFPGSPTAGYLFYSGALLTATITGVNLDTSTYFFSAYAHNPTGYSVTANKKSIGGSSMALIGFIGLAGLLTIAAYALKNGVLKWIGAGGWVLLGWYAFTLSTAAWDLYYSFGFMAVFVAVAVAFEYTWGEYQERRQTKVNVNVDMENYRKEYMGQREILDSMKTTSGVSRRRAHVAGTNDEERILRKSQNLFTQKLEEKYGKPKKR